MILKITAATATTCSKSAWSWARISQFLRPRSSAQLSVWPPTISCRKSLLRSRLPGRECSWLLLLLPLARAQRMHRRFVKASWRLLHMTTYVTGGTVFILLWEIQAGSAWSTLFQMWAWVTCPQYPGRWSWPWVVPRWTWYSHPGHLRARVVVWSHDLRYFTGCRQERDLTGYPL